MLPIAINHMTVANLSTSELLALAQSVGCNGVELRCDLPHTTLFDGRSAQEMKQVSEEAGIQILAVAEVPAFNDLDANGLENAAHLAEKAARSGASALVLIPKMNDHVISRKEARASLERALIVLEPILAALDLTGLIEPLGFENCSLRFKTDVVEVIEKAGLSDRFRIIHDTFHHYLAGETDFYPAHTAIIHVSGITDRTLRRDQMADVHRVLVDADDCLNNIQQLCAMICLGYRGPVSMEAFAPQIHEMNDHEAALRGSFDFIKSQLAKEGAAGL